MRELDDLRDPDPPQVKRPRNRKRMGLAKYTAFVIAVVVTIGGTAIAIIFLFSQTAPQHPVGAVLTPASCNADKPLEVDLVRSGSSVVYTCFPEGYAFSNTRGTASWRHQGLGGYTGLFLIAAGDVPVNGCLAIGFSITEPTGSLLFLADGLNEYCADSPDVGTWGPFTVEWSQ